jgi:predicted lactoylglutathione lyase
VKLELSMVVLEVADLPASLAFYRLLGLEIQEPDHSRPLVIHRMPSGVSLLFTTGFASRYDADWHRPTGGGYGQLLEFYVGEDATVDAKWHELVDAGYHGRLAPTQTTGPYAAMVDDPDGNVILLTSDEAAAPSAGTTAAD